MRETIFLLALASANSGISLRIIEPMLPRLAEDFGLGIPATASVITAYALASAIGTLAYGPLGDRHGKLRVATVSLFLAGLASFACLLAQGVASLAALRFVTALFASSGFAVLRRPVHLPGYPNFPATIRVTALTRTEPRQRVLRIERNSRTPSADKFSAGELHALEHCRPNDHSVMGRWELCPKRSSLGSER